MKLIGEELNPDYLYLHQPEIIGVELDGMQDAVNLIGRLGAFAAREYSSELMLDRDGAAEALTLQAQLVGELQVSLGNSDESPFVFRAIDRHAGRVLRMAVNMDQADVAATANRSPFRYFPIRFGVVESFDDNTIIGSKLFGEEISTRPRIKDMLSGISDKHEDKMPREPKYINIVEKDY